MTSPCTVNVQLLPVKITYFTLFSAIAVLLPYLPVYMRQLGLSPTETAVILSVSTVAAAPVRALIGLVADKFHRHRTVLIVCCVLTGLFHLCLLFVPKESQSAESSVATLQMKHSVLDCNSSRVCLNGQATEMFVNSTDYNNCTLSCSCVDDTRSSCISLLSIVSIDFESQNIESCIVFDNMSSAVNFCAHSNISLCSLSCSHNTTGVQLISSTYSATFWIYFVLYFVAVAAFSPIISIVDSFAYVFLGDKRLKFGHQRLWGTVGFGVFSVVSGLAMDVFQTTDSEKNYTYSFILFLLLIVSCPVVVCFYRVTVENVTGSFLANVRVILRNVELDLILITAFMAGYFAGVIEGFLFWFLSTLGGPQLLFGLCQLVQCVVETVVLIFSGRLITRFGPMICIEVVFLAFSVRLFLYAFLVNPWCALSIEPLHSLCFGLFYTAITMRASVLTPPGMNATVQSFVGAVYMSLGRAVGVVIGGVLYENFGARFMFLTFSGTSFVYMIMIIIFHIISNRSKNDTETSNLSPTPNAVIDAGDADNTLSTSDSKQPLATAAVQPVVDNGNAAVTSPVVEMSSLLHDT